MPEKQSWLSRLFGRTSAEGAPSDEPALASTRTVTPASPPGGTVAPTQNDPDAAERAAWDAGQALLGDFIVERALGEGGIGKVYLVRSQSSGRRFAVKKTKFRDEVSRRNFLDELRAWIDLPEHPHLTACCFFRTVGNDVVIFADFIAGGPLSAGIRDRRFTRLEQILDLAIQFAWGLQAAHEAGLVHQDVKPGNALLTADGVLKVTDFGLARARAVAGQADGPGGHSVLVSWGGMTPAYCSPEQAAREKLTRKTDVWSWGVSVLELFTGGVTWASGTEAPRVLYQCQRSGPADPQLPALPAAVADVLWQCFRETPSERWASMGEAADALRRAYAATVGQPYPRPAPPAPDRGERPTHALDRWTPFGGHRPDPRDWLLRAFRAAGRDPAGAEALLPVRTGSRQAQAVADLAVYDEAVRIYDRLLAAGRKDLEAELAELCFHKASVHRAAADLPGALALYDRCTAFCERLVHAEGRRDLANDLAAAHQGQAEVVAVQGDHCAAVTFYNRAIALREELVERDARHELANDLADAYLGKAASVADLGDPRAGTALYDRAIALRERLVNQDGRHDLAHDLAAAYLGKAGAASDLGEHRAAVALCDRALALYGWPETREARRDLANDLARTYTSKADAVADLGDPRAAVPLYNRAIAFYQRLVEQEGRRELADALATAYASKAAAVAGLGDRRAALALYDQAVALYERLVQHEGRRELAGDLARASAGKAGVLAALGDRRAAVALYEQAIAIQDRLVRDEGRRELASDLARAYAGQAAAAAALGDRTAALGLYDRAIAIYERLVHDEGRRERAGDLAALYARKANGLAAAGDYAAALALYERVITLREGLIRREGRCDLRGDLAKALAVRAFFLLKLGQRERAERAAQEAVALLDAESDRTGRADVQAVLNWAANALGDVL
jgi:tetratricopeptide (TPR) repeat protein